MRRALKQRFVPKLDQLGFAGRANSFQRILPNAQDLLSLQHWKYGGEFILEFARRERGALVSSWGKTVSEEEIEVAYIDPRHRARLEQVGPSAGAHLQGFDFSSFGTEFSKYEALANQVAELLADVDAWLRERRPSQHVRTLGGKA